MADTTDIAQASLSRLQKAFGNVPCAKADVFVVLGGDGFMLQSLHKHIGKGVPFYGMNRGSVGFLMNTYREDMLIERLENADSVTLHPLVMNAWSFKGRH